LRRYLIFCREGELIKDYMPGEVNFVSYRIKAFVASMTASKEYARLGPEF
jgi:hypothetical protein